jgi:hypothetical protein
MNSSQTVRFEAVPMGLRPTHDDEKASRDGEGAVRHRANSKRFFNGVPIDGAGSVSDLAWSSLFSATSRFFNGAAHE